MFVCEFHRWRLWGVVVGSVKIVAHDRVQLPQGADGAWNKYQVLVVDVSHNRFAVDDVFPVDGGIVWRRDDVIYCLIRPSQLPMLSSPQVLVGYGQVFFALDGGAGRGCGGAKTISKPIPS